MLVRSFSGAVVTTILASWLAACSSNGSAGRRAGSGPNGSDPVASANTGGNGAPTMASGGALGAGANASAGGTTGTGVGGGAATGPATAVPGIRRLSHVEYDHTVLDVLKTSLVTQTGDAITSGFAKGFALDNLVNGYDNARSVLVVTPTLAGQYRDAAAKLATEALAGAGLTALAPCAPGADETACATEFVTSLGANLFRRPVAPDEAARFTALFTTERARSDYAASIQQVLEVMLQSPQFLYRSEYGVPGINGTRVLTAYETASLLSYTFWSAPPDAELTAAAAQNQLNSPAAREAQARRLIQSPRARVPLERFVQMWTQTTGLATVTKLTSVYPLFDAAMRQAMLTGQADFIRKTTWDGDGTLGTFLGGDSGLLTQPWLLTVHAHPDESFPIARGKLVRTRLFCQELPSPPKDLKVVPVAQDPTTTTRARFTQHSKDPACSGCHNLMDPIGFGFENYDGIGQFRMVENGQPVDNSGDVTQTEDANGAFHGPGELGTRLAGSAEVARCVARQAFRFSMGYTEGSADIAALQPVLADFKTANNNVRELFVALAKSDQFVTRAVSP